MIYSGQQDASVAKALAEVSRRLKDTRIAIGAIPDLCGFKNANALKNLFKKRYGVSMRDYRNGTRG